jgi:hypothetical protein
LRACPETERCPADHLGLSAEHRRYSDTFKLRLVHCVAFLFLRSRLLRQLHGRDAKSHDSELNTAKDAALRVGRSLLSATTSCDCAIRRRMDMKRTAVSRNSFQATDENRSPPHINSNILLCGERKPF